MGCVFFPKEVDRRALLIAGLCAVIPDADIVAFSLGIPYESPWGHRGWTHSLVFAVFLGSSAGWLFYRRQRYWLRMALWFILAVASHPLLDMLTTGGLGCALLWPFSAERLFFPVRVIRVSPLEAGAFFSTWGLKVLLSEGVWIGLPAAGLILARFFWMKIRDGFAKK